MFTEGGARAAEDGSVCYDELEWCLIYLELVSCFTYRGSQI